MGRIAVVQPVVGDRKIKFSIPVRQVLRVLVTPLVRSKLVAFQSRIQIGNGDIRKTFRASTPADRATTKESSGRNRPLRRARTRAEICSIISSLTGFKRKQCVIAAGIAILTKEGGRDDRVARRQILESPPEVIGAKRTPRGRRRRLLSNPREPV